MKRTSELTIRGIDLDVVYSVEPGFPGSSNPWEGDELEVLAVRVGGEDITGLVSASVIDEIHEELAQEAA